MESKIVVLDGFTINPGDLDWDDLYTCGECVIRDRTMPEEVLDRCRGADVVLTNKVVLNREVLGKLPELRYIGVLATGYNVVDIDAARQQGIVVTNVPGYGTKSVAQHTLALILELANHVGGHSASVRDGDWSASKDFCYWKQPLVELAGLTMGIVGYGQIGRQVGRLAEAFGMTVITHSRTPKEGVRNVTLETLFRESDVISLHCPLTDSNRGMVNAERIGWMKPSAFLINTSRGLLINERDLANALNAGQLAGAAVDVLSGEPPAKDNPLLGARNCIITPHIAWATRASRERLMATAVKNLRAFQQGRPVNVVS